MAAQVQGRGERQPRQQGDEGGPHGEQATVGAGPYQATSRPANFPASSCMSPQRIPRSLTRTSAARGGRGDPLQDERPGQDHVGAARVEADDSLARRLGPYPQARDLLGERRLRQPVTVDARRVVAHQRLGHRRQRGDRSRHADQRDRRRDRHRERDARQGGVDRGRQGGDLLESGRVVADEGLGQADRSERQADVELHRPARGDDDLRRAAADVDHHQRAGEHVGESLRDRAKGERRLTRPVDHLDRPPQDLGSRIEKRRGVGRAPQRLGPHRGDRRVVPPRDRRERAQGVQRARDPFGPERASGADAPPEARDLGPLLDPLQRAGGRAPALPAGAWCSCRCPAWPDSCAAGSLRHPGPEVKRAEGVGTLPGFPTLEPAGLRRGGGPRSRAHPQRVLLGVRLELLAAGVRAEVVRLPFVLRVEAFA